jgi:tRNA(Arg) A34 adenosine deaminase TadA
MTPSEPGEPGASPIDLEHLRRTFRLAAEARAKGKHPFAALVVDAQGEVVAEAGNNSLPPDGDPTQHAEVLAAARAARLRTPTELAGATLYASAEPCCMCAGAIYWCHIGRVVYGLSEKRLLGLTGAHAENPTLALDCRRVFASGQHPVAVAGPLLEDEAAGAHRGFWRAGG